MRVISKKIKKGITSLSLIFVLGSALGPGLAMAQQEQPIAIDFFYSSVCPHCKAEKEFLIILKEKYPQLEINQYEVTGSRENQETLKNFYQQHNVPASERGYVPVTFTPSDYFIGFSEQIGKDIENCLVKCMDGESRGLATIALPILGEINTSQVSLPILTIVLGALDGFNPCAMWVLLFLIALLINVRSKKKMYLIGGAFILASGVVYYLILAAWLNLFLAISYVNLTRVFIGIFALAVGVWQIASFCKYQPGTCQIMEGKGGFQEKIRGFIKKRTEKLVGSPLTLGILGGIVVLALAVNLVEFFCSAGLPAIFTRVLSLNQISTVAYYFYLLLYTFVFMLDDLIVFLLATFALSKISLTEKYNYWATLIGGVLILTLGILLIFKPEILMFA